MTRPLLSVVTVVRNDRAGLAATAASLRAQRWRGFEWLVADGASADGTAQWLAAHAADTAWWRSAADAGPYDAMNAGLAAARGDWVLFLNAGDTLAAPDTLRRVAAALDAAPHADFLYADALERLHDGRIRRKPARSHRLAAFGMFTHHQAMLYRHRLVARLRFDTRWTIGADYAFTLHALRRARRVERLHFPLCVFAGGGLSQRHAAAGRADQAAIRREVLGSSRAFCLGISLLQWAALILRRRFARVYETLRFGSAEI
ncbi:glycosyltransferase family 2 protein [Azospirillum sp. ST 5-10]|uniref:glycosyltransferase family 2 protein n=1 Tax=unclassified Azospirillum TaxID=2630922 RepID=UPI003F4A111C